MELIQVGPIQLRLEWIVLFAGGCLGMIAAHLLAKKMKYELAWDADTIVQAAVIGVMGWKLSPVLIDPSLIMEFKWSVVNFAPPENGKWIGLFIAAIYLVIYLSRLDPPMRWGCLDLLGIAMAVLLVTKQWVNGLWNGGLSIQWIEVSVAVLESFILYWLWLASFTKLGTGEIFADFLSFSGLVLLARSLFIYSFEAQKLLLETGWLGMTMTVTGLVFYTLISIRKERDSS
ncbi:hypothetical protein [Thermoactinomyces mirandus]|uniref:Prolipoprotein diacylglyceryl transferase n=1 Tax=Thermoactinomyces mirandus TaxID=2756294 RepID=A0A7W2APH8_9BACL|nr:hypothetical protein [Thermoactinomyces mirandus]MBA4600979.1 hypothetical protein [Thermoactinomyces mirandus]